MICVFDIETVPDIELVRQYYELDSSLSEVEICQHAFSAQKEKSGSEFLPIYWHRVVSISSVICDEYGKFIKVGNFGKKNAESTETKSNADSSAFAHLADERVILSDFLRFINSKEPRLVSFNGRGFDLPTIMLRAMKYNLSTFGYFESENASKTKNKWENYRARYSEKWHTDLLECLGNFGSVRNLNLDNVCKMLGIVGKYEVSGGDVYSLYYDKKDIEKIDFYCQSDVLNTYWLYLKYAILKDELRLEDYAGILEDFKEKLPKDREYSQAFIANINAELGNIII
ncbi:3'-5' exonuclease [Helicobacter sp. MIT 01-3238]|uniref:3'-5' exonuclease n=1 Tax=Helicobacter sp. MIT 01-3238 TaxID=398627 RepID=UPI000E1E5005|nr:3'-5' exonuclease [Helicobacter sp. MIT 01-3238]RDU52229.1 3'-5' exonuclease [Helicobacter sp. MIT 01-3238]